MRESGIFRYKCNLYYYCERYMIAFSDKSYGEMVLQPPPLSYLTILMVFFTPLPRAMVYISKFFSYLMFWIENVFLILGFLGFEIFIFPFAYIKIWFNIVKNSMGVLRRIINCFVWAIIGMPMMLFIVFRDMAYILKILGSHQGCR